MSCVRVHWKLAVSCVAAADHLLSHAFCNAVLPAPATGSRAVANQSGERGLLVVEPITAAAAAAAAGAPGAAAAAASHPTTALEAAFSADASAAVGVSALLAGRRAAALGAQEGLAPNNEGLGFGDAFGPKTAAGSSGGLGVSSRDGIGQKRVGGIAGLIARGLGVADEAAAAAAGGGAAGGGYAGWRLVLLSECTPQQLVQVRVTYICGCHARVRCCSSWGSNSCW
jgi:hypothetical protein